MKNSKHTPGPWIVLKVGDKRRSSDNGLLDRIVTERCQLGIADCVPQESSLIAAAPELLDALEWALENIEGIAIPEMDKQGRVTSLNNAAAKARAAIRKARGN